MKVLNYVFCSTFLAVGLMLLISNNEVSSLCGLLWLALVYYSGRTKPFRKVWRRFAKTNLEIERYFEE